MLIICGLFCSQTDSQVIVLFQTMQYMFCLYVKLIKNSIADEKRSVTTSSRAWKSKNLHILGIAVTEICMRAFAI